MNRFDEISNPRRWSFQIGVLIVLAVVVPALLSEFFAPYPYHAARVQDANAPPSHLEWRRLGGWPPLRPVLKSSPGDGSCEAVKTENDCLHPIILFPAGPSYRLFGFLPMKRRLFGVQDAGERTPRLYLLGADEAGRDLLSRLLTAANSSIRVAIASTILAGLFGVIIGATAGYASQLLPGRFGQWMESGLMRMMDCMLALPSLLLILAARAAYPPEMRPRQAEFLMIGIFVALGWAEIARLTSGLVLDFRHREFVLAARSLGASSWRVLRTHILLMASRPLLAQTLLLLSDFFLAETTLSFLGVGLQPPEPSWGNMLKTSFTIQTIRNPAAWTELSPAVMIIVFVFGVRLLAQSLDRREKAPRIRRVFGEERNR